MTTREEIETILKNLPHKLQVTFAVYCANDAKHLMPKEGIAALELTDKWLKTPHLVSEKELVAAANAASAAAYAAHAAASAAAHAANVPYAAYAAHAAANAANAAYAAHVAAHAAINAAYAAAYANKREEKLKEYKEHLVAMINGLTELEKVIWNLK